VKKLLIIVLSLIWLTSCWQKNLDNNWKKYIIEDTQLQEQEFLNYNNIPIENFNIPEGPDNI
jgi:hypothetical protein